MPDKIIKCRDCGEDFTFTEGEQNFYDSKNPPLKQPKRCKDCRAKKRAARQSESFDTSNSEASLETL